MNLLPISEEHSCTKATDTKENCPFSRNNTSWWLLCSSALERHFSIQILWTLLITGKNKNNKLSQQKPIWKKLANEPNYFKNPPKKPTFQIPLKPPYSINFKTLETITNTWKKERKGDKRALERKYLNAEKDSLVFTCNLFLSFILCFVLPFLSFFLSLPEYSGFVHFAGKGLETEVREDFLTVHF